MSEVDGPWLDRGRQAAAVTDDAGAVLRAWRARNSRTQGDVAAMLHTTQQHLSQMEKGTRPLTLELRRPWSPSWALSPRSWGCRPGRRARWSPATTPVRRSPPAVCSGATERRWLNQHRNDLARLAAALYPAEYRVERAPLIAAPEWMPDEPIDMRSVALDLDEGPQHAEVDGTEPESSATRPLRIAGARFDHYTSAVKCLDRPQLFESRPSYRLLDASLTDQRLGFGLAAYFDKLDVSESLGHELAGVCMADPALLAAPSAALAGRLPFRDLVADPFDPQRRAVIPAITTLDDPPAPLPGRAVVPAALA